MDFATPSDQTLVDKYTEILKERDGASENFDLEAAGAVANELETRGYAETADGWVHRDKPTLNAVEPTPPRSLATPLASNHDLPNERRRA